MMLRMVIGGGALTRIIMDEQCMVWETLPPPFFCKPMLSLAVARKLLVEIDNFPHWQEPNFFTNVKDVINFNRLHLLATIQLVFNGMQEMCRGSWGRDTSLWVPLSRHVGAACWGSGYLKRVTLTEKITELFANHYIFSFQQTLNHT